MGSAMTRGLAVAFKSTSRCGRRVRRLALSTEEPHPGRLLKEARRGPYRYGTSSRLPLSAERSTASHTSAQR
jgi:hypothetical protein